MKLGNKLLVAGTLGAITLLASSFIHLMGMRAAEKELSFVTKLAGAPNEWNDQEKRVMQKVTSECRNTMEDAEKGQLVVMVYCWRNNASGVTGVKEPEMVLEGLLAKNSKTNGVTYE